jgi:hypothetical protein
MDLAPLAYLRDFLEAMETGSGADFDSYANCFYALAEEGYDSLADYLFDHLRYDESPFGDAVARGRVTPVLEKAARRDLQVLADLANTPCAELKGQLAALLPESWAKSVASLPEWNTGAAFQYETLVDFYRVNGCGRFAKYRAFVWADGRLNPVEQPDFRPLNTLWGFERQRDQVIENTRALVEGKPVNNVLLYGSSGTGKSATVKAMLGVPGFESLRLIEVEKEDLTDIPKLVRNLGHRPQKFVIFIDDLAFDKEDKTFSSLKSILEGSLEARPSNVVIYCTSNRRNLVRQNFSDRSGDELDARETIADKTSLAERFGLRILYSELRKDQFLNMCHDLATAQGVTMETEEVDKEAVKWDIRHPSRTPRSANQFVASLLAKQR